MTEQQQTDKTLTPAATSDALIGVAPLMRKALADENLTPLGEQLLARAQANPADANALLDFSTILQLLKLHDAAMAIQANALEVQQLYHQRADREPPGLRLLVIKSPGDLMANTPIECLLEGSDVSLDILYLSLDLAAPEAIPNHDVLFVAIGESDRNQPLLESIVNPFQNWPRPVINPPGCVRLLSRPSIASLLQGIPGIEIPMTLRIDRANLSAIGMQTQVIRDYLPDAAFPLIVRPIDSHAGQQLAKIDSPADLTAYLDEVDAPAFYISRFVDYRSADGQYRKYRIAMIEGRPYLCHLGISNHWMIHYLNAGMADDAIKRAEEEQAMLQFDANFASRHSAALAALQERVKLDYYGIDCAENKNGDLLIFEVDTAMVVHAMDPVDRFAYKQPQMQKVFRAFRDMLEHARQRAVG